MAGIAYNMVGTTGHGTYPPTNVPATQTKVFVQNKAIVCEGDSSIPHTNTVKPYDTHSGTVISLTNKVFVQGKKAGQIGDPLSCGDTISQASGKVFALS